MSSFRVDPAVAGDAAAVAEVVAALEASLYGQSMFSQADQEDEWLELDLEQDARVVRDGDRIVGYGVVRERGELWRVEGYVHPDALEFHAAHQEAFADAWDYTPRDFESWSKLHLGSESFDPALWCVVRAGDEIAAGTICRGATYGGGYVDVLFTRRPWRKQGAGAALLGDSFGRFWERGERRVGLSVDTASDTGAFRLYERAGMAATLGWLLYEKDLGDAGAPTTRH